jgi:hypothetical protein
MKERTRSTISKHHQLEAPFNDGTRTSDAGETCDPQAGQRPTKLGLEVMRGLARDQRKDGPDDEEDR